MNSKYIHVDFAKANECSWTDTATGAVATWADGVLLHTNVNGHNFEIMPEATNTAGATTGTTANAAGWLLPFDNTANEGLEITNGIVQGSALSFVVGTDPAFFFQTTLIAPTLANVLYCFAGFRQLGAYAALGNLAAALTAYDNKAWMGIRLNAGELGSQRSLATVDAQVNAAHANYIAGQVLALRVDVNSAGLVTFKLGHAAPTGATYAEIQTAKDAAISNLAVDATLAATAYTFAAATEVVPAFVLTSAGGGAISDLTLLSWTCGLA